MLHYASVAASPRRATAVEVAEVAPNDWSLIRAFPEEVQVRENDLMMTLVLEQMPHSTIGLPPSSLQQVSACFNDLHLIENQIPGLFVVISVLKHGRIVENSRHCNLSHSMQSILKSITDRFR